MNAIEFANAINSNWYKTVGRMLATAELCAQADDTLSGSTREELLSLLCFSAPMFCKLAKVGRCDWLRSEAVRPNLPNSVSTLYELSHLALPQRQKALDENLITPKLTRSQLVAWKRDQLALTTPPRERVIGFVVIDNAVSDDQADEIRRKVEEVLQPCRARFEPKRDLLVAASARALARHDAHMRKRAREIVKKATREAKKKGPGFPHSEVEIRRDASTDRVREVLEWIGSDQFPVIQQEAADIYDQIFGAAHERYMKRLPPAIPGESQDLTLPDRLDFTPQATLDRIKRWQAANPQALEPPAQECPPETVGRDAAAAPISSAELPQKQNEANVRDGTNEQAPLHNATTEEDEDDKAFEVLKYRSW